MLSITGCGEPKPTSVTEGIEVSEIQAYEARVKEMEAQTAKEMDE
ncbi:hypothetical protein [Rhodopirellula sp. SWK7]|nr:hypothetical protein [Rhodopirellula sp. SWK7]